MDLASKISINVWNAVKDFIIQVNCMSVCLVVLYHHIAVLAHKRKKSVFNAKMEEILYKTAFVTTIFVIFIMFFH